MTKRLAYGARAFASAGAVLGFTALTASALVLSFPIVSVPVVAWAVPVLLTASAGALLVKDDRPKRVDVEKMENDDTVEMAAVDAKDDEPTQTKVFEKWLWRPFDRGAEPLKAVDQSEWVKALVDSRPYSHEADTPDLAVQQTQPIQPVGSQQQTQRIEVDEATRRLLPRFRNDVQLREQAAEAIGVADGKSNPLAHGSVILREALGRWFPDQGDEYNTDYTDACRAIARVRPDPKARFTPREVHVISRIRRHNALEYAARDEVVWLDSMSEVVSAEQAEPFQTQSGPEHGTTLGG